MANNEENILVEFDYQNISVIDPNKVIDSDGNVKERLIQQENLVYYANLECAVTPRTKLALGVPQEQSIQTVSVGTINFLNPGLKKFLDTDWSDELTGKDTIEGAGVNQPKINVVKNSDLSDDYYINQTIKSNGKIGAVDNGLLGITQININYGLDFLPEINITMEDVKGRALFEAGNNSPYAVFFNLPYPLFYLTIKGYLGKAVRLPLMLQTFNASFDPSTHNFRIQCKFLTYKYTVMSNVTWGQMMAVPQMYRIKIDSTTTSSTNPSDTKNLTSVQYSSGGYQKMKELYKEYKSKGLIDDDFPEITILELKKRLGQLITNIENNFRKKNLNVLNDLTKYSENLGKFQTEIYLGASIKTWARTWLDFQNIFIQNDESKTRLYKFKDEFNDINKQNEAITKLEGIIKEYLTLLNNNKAVGDKIQIPVEVSTFFKVVKIGDINVAETLLKRTGNSIDINTQEFAKSRQTLNNELNNGNTLKNYPGLIFFTGPNSFEEIIKKADENFLVEKQKVENKLTQEISDQFADKNNGLGFQPTIRNVLAVFFAQGEAFLRLLDDIHTNAWNLREDENRKKAILNTSSTVSSVDKKTNEIDQPIYPWPQLIVENLVDGKEKYEIKYPGDFIIANKINAFVPEIWPEVQFVEEFLRGFVERSAPQFDFGDGSNALTKPQRLSFNGIEFTVGNDVFQNTEEVKFFYELYERMLLNSFYSKFNRNSIKNFNVQTYVAESETLNILNALGSSSPFLAKKIKEYNIDSVQYNNFLRHISNEGQGPAWQNFIRGSFNTPYISNDTQKPFDIYKASILSENVALPNVSLENDGQVKKYFGGDIINEDYDFSDNYPLTNLDWCKNYLANGNSLQSNVDTFKTSDTLQYDSNVKTIRNKSSIYPVVNFNYKQPVFDQTIDLSNLNTFYQNRTISSQYATEGNLSYSNYGGNLTSKQTTSILNTPYFINSIQKGINEYRYNTSEKSPFKSAAYLFLNSLPLATLKDKYRVYNPDGTINVLSYILPTFKKFGAIHELPYAWILKYGSIWSRYKTFKETGVDFLNDVWGDFDYIGNYDPGTQSSIKTYQVTISGQTYTIVLDGNLVSGPLTQTQITTGFYPKLFDDFSIFLNGEKLFNEVDTINGTCYFSGNTMEVLSINYNTLQPGFKISGSSVDLNTTIISQVSGVTGGVGLYIVDPQQTQPFINVSTSTKQFIITNQTTGGYSNSTIQNALNNRLRILQTSGSIINRPTGFDISALNRSLILTPWSCYLITPDNQSLYTLPSLGSNVNQTFSECFTQTGIQTIEVSNNPAIHNGSVRLFWKAPNYGYFNNSQLTPPSPEQYIKEIFNNSEEQENFGFYGDNLKYSKIDELFTTFSPEILDQFEEHFLNFSKSIYDFNSILKSGNIEKSVEERNENFQGLMRSLFLVPNPTGLQGNVLIDKITEDQKQNIQKSLDEFMNYMVVFKNGNPTNFDKKLFYSFSTQFIQDGYSWEGYVQTTPNALPVPNGTVTVVQSKTQYPEAWTALEKYVGFSEISQLRYTDNGSYITDFFIDMNVAFKEENIKLFSPIIKLYATQKLNDPTLNQTKFFELMNQYITGGESYLNLILDDTLVKTRSKLGTVNIVPEDNGVKFTEFNGEQTRLELWETFKAINDKWISGGDFKTKTIFEDVLIQDRASRDVGQKIFVDIFKTKDMIEYMDYKNNMLGIVENIFVENRFKSFIIPSYANFYGVQDASKSPTPNPEGSLEFANSLFGTFLTVDYTKTSAKYLSIYAYVPSNHLALNENVDYRYRDDAFDLRRASDNPLTENQEGKTDWDKSNKVVGFNVDFGPQNQQVFKQIDISQDPGKPTAESEQVLTQMANQNRNRGGTTQSVSLYNVYRNRSYKCSIDMMGNALIQPTMYFNLRNIPMFSGPYMITNIQHRISENGFDTTFEGQRQPFYSIPAIDSLLQSLTTKILETLKERLEQQDKEIQDKNNIIAQKSDVINRINGDKNVLTANQNCASNLNSSFSNYTNITPTKTTITFGDAKEKIREKINKTTLDNNSKLKLWDFISGTMYAESGNGQSYSSYDHNYASINLNINPWGGSITGFFNQKYYCVNRGQNKNIPLASFNSFDDFLDFFIGKFSPKVSKIVNYDLTDQNDTSYKEKLAKANVTLWPSNLEDKVWDDLPQQEKTKLGNKMATPLEYLKTL
jgi:hypothetical protein